MKNKFNASTLRLILISSIAAIGLASAVGFGYGLNYIQKYAVEVSRKKVDAEASNGTVASLQKAQERLDETKDVRDKLQLLKSDSDFPEFRVYDEVKAVAERNGIQIESFSYGDASTSASTSTPTQQPATTTPAAPATGASGNTIALTVKLQSPVNYNSYLQFLYDLEQRLPILKVENISLSPSDSNEQVTIDQLTIQMYKR